MASIWKEPLVHFALLGGALFAGHTLWEKSRAASDYTIEVSTEELERQAIIFAGENRRQPTEEDLTGLLFAYVEEQALMREAKRLGLDEDDTIIRRRLAQKMRFMIEDVEPPAAPTEDVLEAWFKSHMDQFITPERRRFSHIYLSPQSHGETLEADAAALLARANNTQDWKALGDPFMMKRTYEPLTQTDVARLFGGDFAEQLFSLAGAEAWQGPLSSAYGLHLVRISETVPKVTPTFAEARPAVLAAWQDQAQRSANAARLKTLIEKYKVKVEDDDA